MRYCPGCTCVQHCAQTHIGRVSCCEQRVSSACLDAQLTRNMLYVLQPCRPGSSTALFITVARGMLADVRGSESVLHSHDSSCGCRVGPWRVSGPAARLQGSWLTCLTSWWPRPLPWLQGGALVDVGPLRGFVPLSKMDPARLPRNAQNGASGGGGGNGLALKDLAHLVGKPISAKVIEARSHAPARTSSSCLALLCML